MQEILLALIIGCVVGYILAIPPGPIAVAVIRAAAHSERKKWLGIASGAAAIDALYCVVLMIATAAIFGAVSSYTDTYPLAFQVFQAISVLGMIVYGLFTLRSSSRNTAQRRESQTEFPKDVALKQEKQSMFRQFLIQFSGRGAFFIGVALALANLANPTFLPSMTYMTLLVHQYGFIGESIAESVTFSAGFALGVWLWLYSLASIIEYYREQMNTQFLARLNHVSGLTILGFGTYLGWKIVSFRF